MNPGRPYHPHLVAAALLALLQTAPAEAARPSSTTTTFKGVRPRPSPDQTFRGA